MAELDLDDRRFSDMSREGRTEFFPRTDCKTVVKLKSFEQITNDETGAQQYELNYTYVSVTPGKTDPQFEPCPDAGTDGKLWFATRSSTKGKVDRDMKALRRLLAAVSGVPHTEDFKANGPLTMLVGLEDFAPLDEIQINSEAWLGKMKDDGSGNWVNNKFNFAPVGK
mgnify:CR=1 FL=1